MAQPKKNRWPLSLSLSLGLAALPSCETRQEPQKAQEKKVSSAPTQSASDATRRQKLTQEAKEALTPLAVERANFARKILYTWTTREQIEALRSDEKLPLLSRSESPEKGPSGFDRVVSASGGFVAEALASAFDKRRFAWPAAFATSQGFQGEAYGDQLLRVSLKNDALIAGFFPGTDAPWQFRDLFGNTLTEAQAQARLSQLAAVYYEAKDERGLRYREYVLCQEAMIESWSYASPDVLSALESEEAALQKVFAWGEESAAFGALSAALDDPASAEVRALYQSSLAFPDAPYALEKDRLLHLIGYLNTVKGLQAKAILRTPSLVLSVPPIKKPPIKKPAPSLYGSY